MDKNPDHIDRVLRNLLQIYQMRGLQLPALPDGLGPFFERPLATFFVANVAESTFGPALQYAMDAGCSQLVIVSDLPVKANWRTGTANNVSYRAFCYQELLVDIFQHYLVPQQILLSEQDSEDVKQRYMVRDDQLARMLATDPVAMRLGAERGRVILVKRGEDEVAYRCVI